MKKAICFVLAFFLLIGFLPQQAKAAENQNTTDGIFYGVIRVLKEGTSEPEPYRAARDPQGNVYIHFADFAALLGASMETADREDTYCYRFGNWNLVVFCREKAARLYYNPGGNGLNNGIPIYGEFSLEKVIFQKQTKYWYLPMEEMLYMSLTQWGCANGFVSLYRAENLLDVLADLGAVSAHNPGYEDLMGDTTGEVLSNSFMYGVLAGADELDATFIADSFLIGIGYKETLSYEDEVLKKMLVLLSDDSPYKSQEEAIRQAGTETLNGMSDFASNASAAMTIVDPQKQTLALGLVAEMLGNTVELDSLDEIFGVLDDIGDSVSLAEQTTDYVFGVANSLWMRDYLSQNFGERLLYLQELTAKDTDNSFARQLNKVSGNAYKEYYGSVSDAFLQNITLNHIVGTLDAISGMVMPINVLNTPIMILSMVDFGIEMSKTIPAVGDAFAAGEDAINTLYLLRIYAYTAAHANSLLSELEKSGTGLDAQYLNDLRLSCQIAQNAAMHAHVNLIDMGKMANVSFQEGTNFLQRLSTSAAHDGLLTITNNFVNIYSDTPGCIRMQIPPEYVFAGDGIFLAPINQLTKAPADFIPIETDEDLLKITDNMNGSYILMNDLEIDNWTPLGSEEQPFTGTFDGNGHSITIQIQEYIDFEEDIYGGLFCVLKNATVKNVHIKGDWIYRCQEQDDVKQFYGNMVIGGISAYAVGKTTITNCVNSANINKNGMTFWYTSRGTDDLVAGILGGVYSYDSANVRISYCRNIGDLISGNDVGGIVCTANDATIFACQNEGDIDAGGFPGGIAATSSGYIGNCANLGDVLGADMVGGIASTAVYIENCINTGFINANGGGAVRGSGIVDRVECVRNCINIGKTFRGAILFCSEEGEIVENCYWDDNAEYMCMSFSDTPENNPQWKEGHLTDEEMTDQESFEGFDFMNTWTLYEGMRCPYPSLLLLNGQTPPMLEQKKP